MSADLATLERRVYATEASRGRKDARFHFKTQHGRTRCSGLPVDEGNPVGAVAVLARERCAANGCHQQWEQWRVDVGEVPA